MRKIITTLLLVFPTSVVWAESSTHRSHEAHVHGHAALNLVVSGSTMQLEFNSPAMNLLGFEHIAKSAQDRQRVLDVAEYLQQAKRWIKTDSSAVCQLVKAEVISDQLDHEETEKDDHHTSDEASHTDFEVMVSFECKKVDRLKSVDISGLFNRFPGIEEVEVQSISDHSQSAAELRAQQSVIRLD